ncbi:hypothetical protein V9K67_05690 [Paraflavisolibacter sp. H34]|uniref:hypothetical protein n=1 Tax=Huijunlia imazamoxiresistens TaxID=3127457 RepID=UPI0030183513
MKVNNQNAAERIQKADDLAMGSNVPVWEAPQLYKENWMNTLSGKEASDKEAGKAFWYAHS